MSALTAALVMGGATVVSSAISASSSKKAANAVAKSTDKASAITQANADQARKDAISLYAPAMTDYVTGVQKSLGALSQGKINSIGVLQESTNNAGQILNNSYGAAQAAILGVPYQQYTQSPQYQQIMQQGYQNFQQVPIEHGIGTNITNNISNIQDQIRQAQPVNQSQMLNEQQVPIGTGADTQYAAYSQQSPDQTNMNALQQNIQYPLANMAAQQQGYVNQTVPALTGNGMTGVGVARGDVMNTSLAALQALGLGGSQGSGGSGGLGSYYNMPGIGGGGGGSSAINKGIADLTQAGTRGEEELRTATSKGISYLDPYSQAGNQAVNLQAALTGALGTEAQQQAMQNFTESPGQAWLRQQQEKALLRNQAAIGGLGGGNVRTALQEQAYGISAQQYQDYLNNISQLAQQGQGAASQQGSMAQAGGTNLASFIGDIAAQKAGLRGTQASIAAQLKAASIAAATSRGNTLASLQANKQLAAANILTGAGQNLAGLAESGGLNLANLISQGGTGQAGLQTQYGTQAAGLEDQYGTNVANIYGNLATNQAGIRQDLATTLGNISTGTGTQISNLAQQAGAAQASGQLGVSNAWNQGVQNLASIYGSYIGSKK